MRLGKIFLSCLLVFLLLFPLTLTACTTTNKDVEDGSSTTIEDTTETDEAQPADEYSTEEDNTQDNQSVEDDTTQETSSKTVYVTRTGEKYHSDGCQYLSKSKIETTLSDAKADGYTACSKCGPP